MQQKLGIIGGTGFYKLDGLEIKDHISVDTPFGEPSDRYAIGKLNGTGMVFLARHGEGHQINPRAINYRANVYGMKKLGVTHILSISAVGSFKEEVTPGSLVLVDQFFDRSKDYTQNTFFDDGIAVHIAFSDPVCPVLHKALIDAADELGLEYRDKGIYLNMEGPAFSTRAESTIYRSWGVDVIGMTNMTEARLCREAEMHFATIAQVTDYDSWRMEPVDVPFIMGNLAKALENSKMLVKKLTESFPPTSGDCQCKESLKTAIVTDPAHISSECKERCGILLQKYLD